MENLNKIIGNRLGDFINKIGMSKGQFSKKLGYDEQSNLTHLLNGNRSFSRSKLLNIYEKFPNLNPEWLEKGIGDMYRQISNSQNGTLLPFEDENRSKSVIYISKNDEKPVQEILQDRKKEQETPKNSHEQTIISDDFIVKLKKEIVEGITEKQNGKKIKEILIFYDNGTYEKL